MNSEQYAYEIKSKFEKINQEVQKPNILLVGGTGVGKSSLINLVFGEELVKSGIGAPITQKIERISNDKVDVNIFDSAGYELENEETFYRETIGYVEKCSSLSFENQIHLIWHLVDASSNRVLEYDLKLNEKLKKLSIPSCTIYTKCDGIDEASVDEMIKVFNPSESFENCFTTSEPPFFITTQKDLVVEESNLDYNKVVKWSIGQLPEVLKEGFIRAQKSDLESKRVLANTLILRYSTGAAAIGVSPIPFSDAPLLLGAQTAMFTHILKTYGLNNQEVLTLVKGASSSLIISNVGRSLAGNILKLIPGVGTVAGGVINAGVASAITYAIGKALSMVCEDMCLCALKGDKSKYEDILNNFSVIFSIAFKSVYNKK
ncbi:50S ribosome-binding GTPase [Halosquirtibacter laminarini]|uniref:50S ribosome-binding GTPase n=1 Tax=Halosquirtibacter laminarini TaxID=3374600 RepID=A0AC61NNX1_9BACT|nr:50S ribosome-binding GTPase [Prolixibacteraceae bacterium]